MSETTAADRSNELSRHLIDYGFEFFPELIASAQGVTVRDVDGREILDFTSGQMCATLGHNHPEIVAAIEKACREAIHLYSGMISVPVVRLAEELAALLPPHLQKMMFLNTGAEANEAALRMAKLHTGRFEVVALAGSWHGMTAGVSSITYAAGHRGYGPAMPGTMAVPAPNCYRCPVRHCRDRCDMTCLEVGFAMVDAQCVGSLAAVVAEPVLSTAGVIVPPEGYFQRLKAECQKRGMLLILDEAQTALGRLGANFAFEIFEAEPDFLSLSKTLGGGVPMAATVTSDEIEDGLRRQGFRSRHLACVGPAAGRRSHGRCSECLPPRASMRGHARWAPISRRAWKTSRPGMKRSAMCAAWACCGAWKSSRTAKAANPTRNSAPPSPGAAWRRG